jgi:hypothetical protein
MLPYLKPYQTLWDPAAGAGHISRFFRKNGFAMKSSDIAKGPKQDFLTLTPADAEYDCIITNPPFSLKKQFIDRCFQLKKPFALLIPLNALETQGVRQILVGRKFSLIFPPKNINYIVPGAPPDSKSVAFFYSVWLTNIPKVKPFEFIAK